MKKLIRSVFLAFVFLTVLLSGCAPASTPVPSTLTPIPPTFTPEPTATQTPIPPTETATVTDINKDSFPILPLKDLEFKNCTIIDKKQLPDYNAWYEKFVAKPFDPNKVKVKPLRVWDNNTGVPADNTPMMYDPSTEPNFPEAESKPFQFRDSVICVKSGNWVYLTIPISYYDPDNPHRNIILDTGFVVKSTFGETWTMPENELNKYIKIIMSRESPIFQWSQLFNGNFTYTWGSKGPVDPDLLDYNTAKLHPEIQRLMQDFRKTGVPKGLDQKDIYIPLMPVSGKE